MSQPEIKTAFVYDPELAYWPTATDSPRVKAVKEAGKLLATEIVDQAPQGPHQTLALRHVEDAVFRAIYAIDQEVAAKEQDKASRAAKGKAA